MRSDHTSALRQMLKMREHTTGPSSPETARALCDLGDAYGQLDDVKNAEICYQRAYDIYEALGKVDEYSKIRQLLEDLRCRVTGDILMDEEALKLSSSNIPVFVKQVALGADQEEQAQEEEVKDGNGHEHNAQVESPVEGKVDKALEDAIFSALNQVTTLRYKGFANTSQLADALVDLASLYAKKSQHDMMETLLLEALSIREKVYGKGHLSVSTDLKNLARLFFMTERFELAAEALARALQIREGQLGIHHPQVADLAEFHAKVLHKLGRPNEARDFELRASSIRERHPSEWEDYKRAANRALEKEDYFEAQAYWLAALEECQDLDKEDPRVLTTHENLAFVYWKRAKYDKAEPHCRKILEISEQLLGKDHFDVATAANNLALVNERQEKYQDAAVLYKHAMALMEKHLGADHGDVLSIKEAHEQSLRLAHKQLEKKLQKSGL